MKNLFICCLILFTGPLFAVTLEQAKLLLENNEQWQKSVNQALVSEADLDIANGFLFPVISARVNYTKQAETENAFLATEQRQVFLNLSHPLFQGFKEFRAKKAAELTHKAQKEVVKAVQRELLLNLTRLYFQVLQAQTEVRLLQESYRTAKEVEKEIEQRQRIGRSRKSELYSAQAQSLRAKSQLETGQIELGSLKVSFWRMLGQERKKIAKEKFALPSQAKTLPAPEEIYKQHPTLEAARLMIGVSKEMVAMEKSDHYPTLGLSANYFLDQEGNFNQPDWNATLNLNFPLFEGGRTSKEIYRAKLMEKDAHWSLIEAQRNLQETLKDLNLRLTQGRQRIKSLAASVKMSQKNYQELRKENKLGLITSLEVMQGLSQYIEQKRAYNQEELNLLSYRYQLLALAGEL